MAESPDDKAKSQKILFLLRDPFTLPYLGFLDYYLDMFNKFNATFQSETPKLHDMKNYVSTLLKRIARGYLSSQYVATTNPLSLNPKPTDSKCYLKLEDIYVGKFLKWHI